MKLKILTLKVFATSNYINFYKLLYTLLLYVCSGSTRVLVWEWECKPVSWNSYLSMNILRNQSRLLELKPLGTLKSIYDWGIMEGKIDR